MFFADNKGLWIGVAILLVMAGAVIWILTTAEPFALLILFDEVGDLKKDAPVMWKGFNIGKVTEIQPLVDNQIGVTIELKEDYVPKITRGAEFYLTPAPLLGLFGKDSIEVVTSASSGVLFARGEKIQAKRRPAVSLVEEGRKWTVEYWRQLKDQTSLLIEEFQRSNYRKETEEALRQLKELTEKGVRQTKEDLEAFRQEHKKTLEQIRKKLETIRDEMRRRGDELDARRIDKQIERMKDK